MAKRTRTRYTNEQKRTILAAAQKDGLTALQVQKKFGVKPITYYSWRKKSGAAGRRGRVARGPGRPAGSGGGGLAGVVRGEVANRVRAMLPDIVRNEVNHYLDSVLGGSAPRRRRRKKK